VRTLVSSAARTQPGRGPHLGRVRGASAPGRKEIMNGIEITVASVAGSMTFLAMWAATTRWLVDIIPLTDASKNHLKRREHAGRGDWSFAAFIGFFVTGVTPVVLLGTLVIWLAKGAPGEAGPGRRATRQPGDHQGAGGVERAVGTSARGRHAVGDKHGNRAPASRVAQPR
jgi:hypothetical protein